MTTEYENRRQDYWDAQSEFRTYAIAQIASLIPAPYVAALFDFNDDDPPRLTLCHLVDAAGHRAYDEEYLDESVSGGPENIFEAIDQVAIDMEFAHWDEASSMLPRNDESTHFIIERTENL